MTQRANEKLCEMTECERITVAPHDATKSQKARADIVCTGFYDQHKINKALRSGGDVLFIQGKYVIDEPLRILVYKVELKEGILIKRETIEQWMIE